MAELQPSEACLAGLVFLYSLNFGPMVFESFTSDWTWASKPPDSFHMFLGLYGHKTAHYWRVVSPLALSSFVLSIVFNWHVVDRRFWLCTPLALYIAVQASTMAYFVPEQERLITGRGSLCGALLKSRADRWISLNYLRIGAGVLAFVCLLRPLIASATS